MIYQFLGYVLPFIITVDLILIGLVILSIKPKKKLNQRLTYGLAIFGFIGFGLFKLLFTVPHAIPSTPVELKIEANSVFTTLYYMGDVDGEASVFWKDHVIGKSKVRYFDLESSVSDGLTVAKRFNGEWYATTIEMNSNKTAVLDIDSANFQKADQEEIKAIEKYRWTEFGNYFSNLLTFTFIVLIIWRIKKYGS